MKKLFFFLLLGCSLWGQTHTEVTIEDSQTISGNKTGTGAWTFSGSVTLSGGGSLSGTFAGSPTLTGLWTFSQAGIYTNTQMNLTAQAVLGGINIGTRFNSVQVGQFATEALSAGVNCSGTVHQCDALGAYTVGNGTNNAIAAYFQGESGITGASVWAINPLVQWTHSNVQGISGEFDINNDFADSTESQALIQDDLWIVSGGNFHPRHAIHVHSTSAANEFRDAAVLESYTTYGLKIFNGDAGSNAIYIIPPDNGTNLEINGRNTANGATVWSITDGGEAAFPDITVNFVASSAANVAQSGSVRFAPGDCAAWRNNAHGADIFLCKNSSDQLTYNGQVVATTGAAQTFTTLTLTAAAPTASAGQVAFGNSTASSATAGANGATPAQVAGYLIINNAGTVQKIPYYAN